MDKPRLFLWLFLGWVSFSLIVSIVTYKGIAAWRWHEFRKVANVSHVTYDEEHGFTPCRLTLKGSPDKEGWARNTYRCGMSEFSIKEKDR